MKKRLIGLFALTALIGLLGFFATPKFLDKELAVAYQIPVGTSFAMASAAIITTWLLLTSLKEFKTTTKIAYYLISAGVISYAFTQLGQTILVFLITFVPEIQISFAVSNLSFLVPYVASALLLFIGIRKLAQQLGIKMVWMSAPFVGGLSLVIALASLLLPHTPDPDAHLELAAKLIFLVMSFAGGLALCATVVVMHVKGTINATFEPAMQWLALSTGIFTLATFQEVIIKDTRLADSAYAAYSLNIVPFLLTGLFFMVAGTALKQTTLKTLPSNATYIDAVTYAAQLVSNPRAIDSILDELRIVTSRLQPDTQQLAPADKEILLKVYFRIEEYLAAKEPIRNITPASLRARMTPEFQGELQRYESKPIAVTP